MEFETIQDFLDNRRFRQWLQTSDPGLDRFWQSWLEENEEKKDLFYKAVSAWLLIREAPENWSEEGLADKLSALNTKLTDQSKGRFILRYRYYAAAVLIFLAGLAWILTISPFSLSPAAEPGTAALPGRHWENIENTTAQPLLVNLPDGSSVLLSEGSALSYDPDFAGPDRVVNLKGEAFFEVVKNASAPFYVHTPALTTKVLGTSFQVRSFDGEENSRVTVMTGRVEVSASSPVSGRLSGEIPTSESIVLAKNEEAVLSKDAGRFLKSVPEPGTRPLPRLPESLTFDLKFVPASEIFSALEKMYGVQIMYDPERFSHCTLTANLEDVPFLKKLELICAGIDAEYSVNGSFIQISGSGCP